MAADMTMGHHLMSMQCGLQALGHLSLVFGLLASGTLSLAVATDFWIYTTEMRVVELSTTPSGGTLTSTTDQTPGVTIDEPIGDDDEDNMDDDDNEEDEDVADVDTVVTPGSNNYGRLDDSNALIDDAEPTSNYINDFRNDSSDLLSKNVDLSGLELGANEMVPVKVHAGLWRTCVLVDEPDYSDGPWQPQCFNINYFSQDNERHDNADTTNSILRAIRKSSPVIVGSLLLMVTALTFSILGNSKRDARTLIAAILYVCSALSLAVGVIFYISAVNDEVSHRKKTHSSTGDSDGFSYNYGWAFFFAGSSFMCAMVAAVNNISLYLRRGLEAPQSPTVASGGRCRDDILRSVTVGSATRGVVGLLSPVSDSGHPVDGQQQRLLLLAGDNNCSSATSQSFGGRKSNWDLATLQSPNFSPTLAGSRQSQSTYQMHQVNFTTPV